ncbi:uncharacterized protein LOC106753163 isoform X1 [Vigna radiata var. radiata]|uniref:Uncharacterized protein LOC106753163 isoform X1 n=1 Tax=Vigna radiata var. radiata TaxID=3916 RepID=A0A3Q0ERR8_VIGRR|nr:uncharacterized protein LOC106753163 isoform X1 [Vigna radiata var. radiata]XP_022633128.1 uncharacterized protein LOC106753163 isoform X1 [Vigna radiata var. radiata]XP_022633129.1 uncharacterized protein LOC106753163 isoform X1 [Vigna radiata var. radiata]
MYLNINHDKHIWPTKNRVNMRLFLHFLVFYLLQQEMAPVPKAVEFARKLAEKHLFRHVTVENLFEDGNHLYRVLDDDLIVVSQCHNISRGISTLKPKPLAENCVKTKVSVQCNI